MGAETPVLDLPYPFLSDPANGAAQMQALAEAVEAAGIAAGQLAVHVNNPVGAHAATAIAFEPAGSIAAEDVQAAIEEVEAALNAAVIAAGNVPLGGATGTALVKTSGADNDVEWFDLSTRFGLFAIITDPAYGAVGDDVTDALAAINAAIAEVGGAGGGVVFVPNGDFYCSGQLDMLDNVTVLGEGYGSHLRIESVDIGIGGTNLSNVGLANLRISGEAVRMVAFITPTGLRVRDCWISGATVYNGSDYSGGIWIDVGTDVWIDAVECFDNGLGLDNVNTDRRSADIMCFSTGANTEVRVTRTTCRSTDVHFNIAIFNPVRCFVGEGTVVSGAISDNAENSGYGILFYAGVTTAVSSKIADAVVHDTGGTGVYVAGCPDTTVVNVTVTDVASTQADGTLSVGGIVINDSPRSKVANCHVDTSGGRGIAVVTTPGATTPSHDVAVTDCFVQSCALIGISLGGETSFATVSGCNVRDCAINIGQADAATTATGVRVVNNESRGSRTTTPAIQFGNVIDFVVSGNRIAAAGGQGIYVVGSNVTITGNVNTDASAGAANTYAGIFFQGANIVCNSNVSINTGANGQIYGIQSTATTMCVCHDNIVKGQTAALSLAAGTDETGNSFTGAGKNGNLHFGAVFNTPTVGAALLSVGSDAVVVGVNRRIRITAAFDGWWGDTAADLFIIALRVDGADVYGNVPVQIQTNGAYMLPGTVTFQTTALAAGARTFDVTAQRAAGTGILQVRGRLIVDDLGPA